MTKLSLINAIVSIENFMGIYRNYVNLNTTAKHLAKFRFFIEICFAVFAQVYIISVSYVRPFSKGHLIMLRIFNICWVFGCCFQSLVNVALSFYTSNDFRKFYLNISSVHKMYTNDALYKKIVKKQRTKFYLDFKLIIVLLIFLLFSMYLDYNTAIKSVLVLSLYVVMYFYEFRYFYENFVFLKLVESIVKLLKFLNAIVSAVGRKVRQTDGENTNEKFRYIYEELLKCGNASQLLVTAGDHLSNCFGAQVKLKFPSYQFLHSNMRVNLTTQNSIYSVDCTQILSTYLFIPNTKVGYPDKLKKMHSL